MVLEIGDVISPTQDIKVFTSTYKTTGKQGTVQNRKLITINSNQEEIYTYQVLFNESIIGTTSSGTAADSQILFWFSSEELGQEKILLEEYDFNEVNKNLNVAKSTSFTAVNVVNNIANSTLTNSAFSDSIFTLVSSVNNNHEVLLNANFSNNDPDIRIQEASQTNFNALNLDTSQAVFQEIAENMHNFNSVQSSLQEEINRQGKQTAEQVKNYNQSKEEDHMAYTEALGELSVRLPEGSLYALRETNWDEALTPPLTVNITPEVD